MVNSFERYYEQHSIAESDQADQPATPVTGDVTVEPVGQPEAGRDVETAFREIVAKVTKPRRVFRSICDRPDVQEDLARIALILERKRSSAQ